MAAAQPPTPPDAVLTSESFVNTFAHTLGLSTNVARGALEQAAAQLPGPVTSGGPEVRVEGAPPDGAAIVDAAPAGGGVTVAASGDGTGGFVTSVQFGDGLVNTVASALDLDADTVRKALVETFKDVSSSAVLN